MENREKLLEIIKNMTDDELALLAATGLDCKKCPVEQTCYDKVVCNRNIFKFLSGRK